MTPWTIAAALLIPLSSCLHAAEAVKAEAEVSASSGPIKLTFRLYKTTLRKTRKVLRIETDEERLKKDYPNGPDDDFYAKGGYQPYEHDVDELRYEALWVQLGITNVGKKPLVISEDIFTGAREFSSALDRGIQDKRQVYFDFKGPDGKAIPWSKSGGFEPGPLIRPEDNSPQMKAEERHHQELVAEWKKAGYSREQINKKLEALDAKEAEESQQKWEVKNRKTHPDKTLNPGETVWTSGYVAPPDFARDHSHPAQAIGDFAEVSDYFLEKAGVYKIRAVYDEAIYPPTEYKILPSDDAAMRSVKKKTNRIAAEHRSATNPEEWNVRARTPWIEVEVRP